MEGVDDRYWLFFHSGDVAGFKGVGVDDVWLYLTNNFVQLFARKVIFDWVDRTTQCWNPNYLD